MRKIINLTASILTLGVMFFSVEAKACIPSYKPQVICLGSPCDTLGETKLDGDNQTIVACLATTRTSAPNCAGGGCVWRPMTVSHAAKLEEAPFAQLKQYNSYCFSGDVAEPQNYAQKKYYDCSNACYYFCQKKGYTSGLLSEWDADTSKPRRPLGECSCFY